MERLCSISGADNTRILNFSLSQQYIPLKWKLANITPIPCNIIAPSLTYIFNLSILSGIFVDDWKKARVIPIYKSDDRRKCENYRPISILPIISELFERKVFGQLYQYLTSNSLLSRCQSGFRPKHSTLSLLVQMSDNWLESMDMHIGEKLV